MKAFEPLRSTINLIALIVFLLIAVTAAKAQCNIDSETSLYNKFLENFKGSPEQQKAAAQIGRDFVAKYGNCPSANEKETTEYIKKWLINYEISLLENNCISVLNNTPEQAFDLCQPYIAKDPENLRPYLLLTLAGAKNRRSTNAKFKENSVWAARKALDLIAGGKTTKNWVLGRDQAEAVGALNYYAGILLIDSSPAEAEKFLTNAARSVGPFSKEPAVYDALARALYSSVYVNAAKEYNSKCGPNPAPECDALYAKAGQMLDRVIDAYARAVALSKNPAAIAATKQNLTTLYKLRHDNSDAGLDQLISEILSKPLP